MIQTVQLTDKDYWLKAIPGLDITDKPFGNATARYLLDDMESNKVRNQIIEEGYFQTSSIVDQADIQRMLNIVQTLQKKNILPIFAAVYDEFWQILRGFTRTFTSILDPGYKVLPDFYVWFIPPGAENSGWRPHRDGKLETMSLRRDGRPTRMTAWIPLTDADTHNSCVYVLPRKFDPDFQAFVRKYFLSEEPAGDAGGINFHEVRALPVQAGAVAGWDEYIFHWGSRSTPWATHPRVNMAIYFHSADSPMISRPFRKDGHLTVEAEDPEFVLDFNDRLTIIANLIDTYKPMIMDKCFSEEYLKFSRQWQIPFQVSPGGQ